MRKKINKEKIIDQIENVRKKNNTNWMNILRIAFKYAPKETTSIKRTGIFIELLPVTGRHDRRNENINVHLQPIYFERYSTFLLSNSCHY